MAPLQPLRDYAVVWYMRILQALVTIGLLAITAKNASDWHSYTCKIPGRLTFNVTAAALTLPVLIYLILSSGPKPTTHLLPWNRWAQLGLDAGFFALWLVTTVASPYNCTSLCQACSPLDLGAGYKVWSGKLFCSCFSNGDLSKRNSQRPGNGAPRIVGQGGPTDTAKQALDAVMIVLFAITLALTTWRIVIGFKARKATLRGNGAAHEVSDFGAASPDVMRPAGARSKQDMS